MNTELLNQHQVTFGHVRNSLRPFRAEGGGVAEFLTDFFESYDEIEYQEAIDLLDIYLNGGEHPMGDNSLSVNSDQINANFDNNNVDIYYHNDSTTTPITIVQTLPLQDFKDIMVMAWEFINEAN